MSDMIFSDELINISTGIEFSPFCSITELKLTYIWKMGLKRIIFNKAILYTICVVQLANLTT